jgi:PE-PPE domain
LSYYIFPNTFCTVGDCTPLTVVTPETAWPLYGGLSALTWRDSITEGVALLDDEVQDQIAGMGADDHLVIFGYSQSAVIASIEKQRLADQLTDEEQAQFEWVFTGNPSRPNGGINARLPFTLPIVEFPYGPVSPTDTNMSTDDIALKWDIIADIPLVVTNPIAMLNALIGGPGFGINHGTYPNPEGDPPTGLVGGYTQEEWQAIMTNPEGYAAANPDVVNVQQYGDTRYITVAPRVLPLVVPLHMIGLGFVADLIEPALRDIIEQTGYDRSIPYGEPTPFRLIPIFNPITLALDLIADIPEGIQQALNGGPPPLNPPEMLTTSTLAAARTSAPEPTETTEITATTENAQSTPKLTLVKDSETAVQQTAVENEATSVSATKPEETIAKPESTPDDAKSDETKADGTKADTDKKADDTKAAEKKADDTKADTEKKSDNDKKAETDMKDPDSAKAAA